MGVRLKEKLTNLKQNQRESNRKSGWEAPMEGMEASTKGLPSEYRNAYNANKKYLWTAVGITGWKDSSV